MRVVCVFITLFFFLSGCKQDYEFRVQSVSTPQHAPTSFFIQKSPSNNVADMVSQKLISYGYVMVNDLNYADIIIEIESGKNPHYVKGTHNTIHHHPRPVYRHGQLVGYTHASHSTQNYQFVTPLFMRMQFIDRRAYLNGIRVKRFEGYVESEDLGSDLENSFPWLVNALMQKLHTPGTHDIKINQQ